MTSSVLADVRRIRPVIVDMGVRVRMYDVTGLHDKRRIGPHHVSQETACVWVHTNGLRHIGRCYRKMNS